MKFILFIVFFPLSGYSQFFTDSIHLNESGKVTYEAVVEQPGSKEELYTKAKMWIAENFKSPNNVIQVDDKGEGLIIVKGSSEYKYRHYLLTEKRKKTEIESYPESYDALFMLKFFLKDNKYKVVISDIELANGIAGVVLTKYIWDEGNINAIKSANLNDKDERMWQLNQLSEKRELNNNFSLTLESVKKFMAKKSESEF
jgi:hypothetical protein